MSDHVEDEKTEETEAVEGETTEEVVDDWTPPSREEHERLLAAKKAADKESLTRKKYLRAHGIDPRTGERLAKGTEGESEDTAESGPKVDIKAVELAHVKKLDAIYAALDEASVDPKSRQLVLKVIDQSAITVDEDGVEGLEEQIAALKEQAPALFKRTRNPAPDPTAVGTGTKKVSADNSRDWRDEVRERFGKGLL